MSVPLVTLVVLDGWGLAPPGPGNAVELAQTPVFDGLAERWPDTTLEASGRAVGLPEGQMGNSEVGHLTIGSGRIPLQDLVRIGDAIDDGSFLSNATLVGAVRRAREREGDVHLLGLVSEGGVHSHIDHLRALLKLAGREGMGGRVWVHAFTDGRDVSPTASLADIATLPADRVATVVGRYWAMDRDARWERTDRALAAIVDGVGRDADEPVEAVRASHAAGVTDEFIEPVVLAGRPRLDPARDAAIFFNFRPDRGRQLAGRLLGLGVDLVTMSAYGGEIACPAAFGEREMRDTLAATLASAGIRQLHAAETEKYAHVTYFFNGGEEDAAAGEEQLLVASPREVASYDQKPEMSAPEVAERVCDALATGGVGFCVVNFANPDMVGHTGSIPATVAAVETVDRCLGLVVEATERAGGVAVVTADHGNAEQLLEVDGVSPHTAHTTNPVPLVLTSDAFELRAGGGLQDIAPTILALLGVAQPGAMTGRSLLAPV